MTPTAKTSRGPHERRDLQATELLDQTLAVLGTEFGRSLRINDNDGWVHHNPVSPIPLCFR